MLNKQAFLALSVLVLIAFPGHAEQGILVVQVANPEGKPIQHIVLATMWGGPPGRRPTLRGAHAFDWLLKRGPRQSSRLPS